MTRDIICMTTEESLLKLLNKRGNKNEHLGAVSYFEDNSEKDFKEDGIPCWYFPKFEKWIGIEKEYSDKYTMHLNDVVIID